MSTSKNNRSTFPDILSDLISESGKKLREIARESGIGVSQLSAYQSGKNEPNMSTLVKLSDYFNVSVGFLVGKSDTVTYDAKIGYAREFTGLSKAAIQALSRIKDDNPEYASVISVMLEDTGFQYYVHLLYNRFLYSAPEYRVAPVLKQEDGVWHMKNASEFHKSFDARMTKIQFDNVVFNADKKNMLDSMITTSLMAVMERMAKAYLERQKKKGGK